MIVDDGFLELVSKRLSLTSEAVRDKREELMVLEGKIKSEVAGLGKVKQSMTYEGAEEKIAELEYRHAHSSLSNAEERQFMRDVDALRKAKKVIKANSEKQSVVDDLKAERVDIVEQLRILRETERDLSLGYRRIKLARTSGVDASAIVESPIEVPEDRVGAIIGKGGSNLRNFETTYNVTIDTERQGGKISIMGTAEAIGAASEAILELANTISEEIELKEAVLITLLIDKAFLVNELQEELGVKIDVIRAKGVCKVTGHVSQLPTVKDRITSLDCISKKVELDLVTIPAIIGKGGANIKKIQTDHTVQLDIDRAAGSITVTGQRAQVTAAAEGLVELYEGLREIEDKSVCAHKAVIMGAVIGRGGATIKSLQQDLHVSLHVEKEEGKEKESSNASVETLCIRGNKEQVNNAKAHIMGLIGVFLSQSVIFSVLPSMVPIIVGKKGATLNGIREKFPDAQIDILGDDGQICIHASNASERDQAKQAIEAIVDANFALELQFEEDSLIALKGKRGADVRALFASHSLMVDMDAATNVVKIKGMEEQVRIAAKACEEFLANTLTEKMALSEDGFVVLTSQISNASATTSNSSSSSSSSSGSSSSSSAKDKKSEASEGEPRSVKRELEEKFSVEIYVSAAEKDKEGEPAYLKIRGSAHNIARVKETVQAVLAGDRSAGSTIIDLHGVPMSTLIGKGGGTLKKLQGVITDARLDLVKSHNRMRVRGPLDVTPAWIEGKKQKVLKAIDDLRSLVTITPRNEAETQLVSREVTLACSLYCVDIRQDGNKFLVRGDAVSIEEARQYISDITTGSAVRRVTLGAVDFETAKRHFDGEGFFSRLRAKFALAADALSITMTEIGGCTIVIKSTPKAADKIRETLTREAQRFLGDAAFRAVEEVNRKAMVTMHGLVFRDSMTKLGLNIELDKAAGIVCITRAVPAGEISAGIALVTAAQQEWSRFNACVDIDEWMIIPIVGKAGANISALQEKTGVTIKVDRPNLCLDVQATSVDTLPIAINTIKDRLLAIREGHFEGLLAADKFGAFLGKGGANITALRKSTGATIDVDSKDRSVKITGTKEKVEAAKIAVAPFLITPEQAEALRVADEEAQAAEGSEKETASSPSPSVPASQITQPLSKSALKRARQKERQIKAKGIAGAEDGTAAVAAAVTKEEAPATTSTIMPSPPEKVVAQVSPVAPRIGTIIGATVSAPAAVAPTPTQAPPAPATKMNVMTKVTIAKNLVHSGMTGADIALACQNFPWDGTRQAFISELETYNCTPALAMAIADASGLTDTSTGGGGGKKGFSLKAVAPPDVKYAVPSLGAARPVPLQAAPVDLKSLTDESSTADILDALIGMGGGAGFKQTSITQSAATMAVLDRAKSPKKEVAAAPSPAPVPAPAPEPAATKPKSTWLGWAGM